MWIYRGNLQELNQHQKTAAAFMLRDLLRRQIGDGMLIKQREILPRLSIPLEVGILGLDFALRVEVAAIDYLGVGFVILAASLGAGAEYGLMHKSQTVGKSRPGRVSEV